MLEGIFYIFIYYWYLHGNELKRNPFLLITSAFQLFHSRSVERHKETYSSLKGDYAELWNASIFFVMSVRPHGIFRTYSDPPRNPRSLLHKSTSSFMGVKLAGGDVNPTHLVSRSWKCRAIPLISLWGHVTCFRVKSYLSLPYIYNLTSTPLTLHKSQYVFIIYILNST